MLAGAVLPVDWLGEEVQMGKPLTITVRFQTGEPGGLRIASRKNWSGQGLAFPRAIYLEVRGDKEYGRAGVLGRTGVYVLWGSPNAEKPSVYVGQGKLIDRFEQHYKDVGKKWWTDAVVFTSTDNQGMDPGHRSHIEARLLRLAAEAKRCTLDNDTSPGLPSISEDSTADAEEYLDNMLLCLPLLGVNFFEQPPVMDERLILFLDARGIRARGYQSAEGFVVLAGAQAVKEHKRSLYLRYINLRNDLLKEGILKDKGGAEYQLVQDHTFTSPSAAASVLFGAVGGPINWKDAQGRSLVELARGSKA